MDWEATILVNSGAEVVAEPAKQVFLRQEP